MQNQINNLNAIILAGGEGTRLRNFVKQIYGYARPKQYCTFIGTRSMLNHTIGRAAVFIPKSNLYVVANSEHRDYLLEEFGEYPQATILEQPVPRDTSAAILLSLLKIERSNPDSVVVIMPSDHFILDEIAFMGYVRSASQFAVQNPNSLIMLGVKPSRLEEGVGWIETGNRLITETGKSIYSVEKFIEKPDDMTAHHLLERGALINTFVLVGKCSAFINQIQDCIPELVKAFEPIKTMLGTSYEKIIINRFYKHLPEYNFSTAVLQNITTSLLVLEMNNVRWSDWGDEERILNDLEKMNYLLTPSE